MDKQIDQQVLADHIKFLSETFGSSIVADLMEEAMLILGDSVRLVSFSEYKIKDMQHSKLEHKFYICHICDYNPNQMIELPIWVAGERKKAYKLQWYEQTDSGAFKHALKHTMPLIENHLTT